MNDCPLPHCRSAAQELYRLRRFSVRRCRSCAIMFRDPPPSMEESVQRHDDGRYHQSRYFSGQWQEQASGPETSIYAAALDRLLPLRGRSGEDRKLLDVGCGTGLFMEMAASRGWNVHGIELSPSLAEMARDRRDLSVSTGEFLEVATADQSYDLITMWDLLEHVGRPQAVVERAAELLKPDGRLLVFTIDASSLFNMLAHGLHTLTAGRLSAPLELLYDARHSFYFTAASLESLLEAGGFKVDRRLSYRAYLGRWLSEPAAWWLRAGATAVDLTSTVIGRKYRQLVVCSNC